MDEEYGFIREKLDIKLLILYILRRLSGLRSREKTDIPRNTKRYS